MGPAERIAEVYEAVAAVSEALDLGCGSDPPVARFDVDAGHRVTGVAAS